MVNMLTYEPLKLTIGGKEVDVPIGTPIHCSIVNANRDPGLFGGPGKNPEYAEQFDPDRENLDQFMTFNGVEKLIVENEFTKRPPRSCPGHDFSLKLLRFVTDRFKPCSSRSLTDSSQFSSTFDMWRKGLDKYTSTVLKLMLTTVAKWNENPPRASDMQHPLDLPSRDAALQAMECGKTVPTWDEDATENAILHLVRWFMNTVLTFEELHDTFSSREEGISWREQNFPYIPPPNLIFPDTAADATMTQFAFSGLACHYTRLVTEQDKSQAPEGAVFVNDVTELSALTPRKPYELYGAAAYFDKNYSIIGIYWSHASRLVKQGDPSWEHAKYVWKTSFFLLVTLVDHLLYCHFTESNALATATPLLPADHPLRTFLKPFTYNTVTINAKAAASLINKGGLVHRIWAFDYDQILKACSLYNASYRFRTLPEFVHPSMRDPDVIDDATFPFRRDANEYWKVVRDYVSDYLNIHYLNHDSLLVDPNIQVFISALRKVLGEIKVESFDDFVDVVAQLVVAVTGIHEHVGQVSQYCLSPTDIGCKLETCKEIQNVQTYTQFLCLVVMTGLNMPWLNDDWSHLIRKDLPHYPENLQAYRKFKKNLLTLQQEINNLNQTSRKYPFHSFNPEKLELSVSV